MKPTINRVFVLLYISALLTNANAQPATTSSPTWHVYFSPGGEVTSAIRRALDNAKSSVLVQAYSFTSAPIAEALVRAHRRGVKVQVILDRSQKTYKYSSADFLANSGILTRIDAVHAIAHNKVMVIDNELVITGSFNFTKAAEKKNAENLLVIHSRELAARYSDNWRQHASHSESFSFHGIHTDRLTSRRYPSHSDD